MFGRQSVVGWAQESKELLIVAAKDGKRPLVLYLKAGPATDIACRLRFCIRIDAPTGVDPLDGLGRNVSRPGQLVFYARRDILRHLVRTRRRVGDLLPRLPPFELPLWIFLVKGNVQSPLQYLRHMLLRILQHP